MIKRNLDVSELIVNIRSHGCAFFEPLLLHQVRQLGDQLVLVVLEKRPIALEVDPVQLRVNYVGLATLDLAHDLAGKARNDRGDLEARLLSELAPRVIMFEPDQLDYVLLADEPVLVGVHLPLLGVDSCAGACPAGYARCLSEGVGRATGLLPVCRS